MGFLDSLFGGNKKAAVPAHVEPPVAATVEDSPADARLDPQIPAVIAASVVHMAITAAITAAIVHAQGSVTAVRFRRPCPVNAWAGAGRQKIMDGRQF